MDAERLVLAMCAAGDADPAVRRGAAALLVATHGRWPGAAPGVGSVPSQVELVESGGSSCTWPELCRLTAVERLSAALAADPALDRARDGRPCRMQVIAALVRRAHGAQRDAGATGDRRRKAALPAALLRCLAAWLQSVPAAPCTSRGAAMDAARGRSAPDGFCALVWDLLALTAQFRIACGGRGASSIPEACLALWTALARARPAGQAAVAEALSAAGVRDAGEAAGERLGVLRAAAVSAALADPAAAVEAWAGILGRGLYASASAWMGGGGEAAGSEEGAGETAEDEEEPPSELCPSDCCDYRCHGGGGGGGGPWGSAPTAKGDDAAAGGGPAKGKAATPDAADASSTDLTLLAAIVAQCASRPPLPLRSMGPDGDGAAEAAAAAEEQRWRRTLRVCGPVVLHSAVLAAAAVPTARDCGQVRRRDPRLRAPAPVPPESARLDSFETSRHDTAVVALYCDALLVTPFCHSKGVNFL
jgi:hypothetical protein